jgi:hypothetical protein
MSSRNKSIVFSFSPYGKLSLSPWVRAAVLCEKFLASREPHEEKKEKLRCPAPFNHVGGVCGDRSATKFESSLTRR